MKDQWKCIIIFNQHSYSKSLCYGAWWHHQEKVKSNVPSSPLVHFTKQSQDKCWKLKKIDGSTCTDHSSVFACSQNKQVVYRPEHVSFSCWNLTLRFTKCQNFCYQNHHGNRTAVWLMYYNVNQMPFLQTREATVSFHIKRIDAMFQKRQMYLYNMLVKVRKQLLYFTLL